MKPRVLVLFSGGLDSRLVVKILEEQVDVECINFILPFGAGCCNAHCSLNFSQKENIKMNIIDCTKGKLLQEYTDIIKSPKHGRGTCMNPCIDCRIFLLKKAKEFADKKKIDIIATGEVLGERPMSQTSRSLKTIDGEIGFEILRPLSAKLLPETKAEKSGLIDRNKLFDIHGRSRKRQIELAEKYNISYPTPAGGCLLCEPEFCKRLKPILNNLEEIDVDLLKIGRHFLNSGIVLSRNEREGEILESIFKKYKRGFLIVPEEPGPSALIKDKKYEDEAKKIIQQYSKKEITKFNIFDNQKI
jgi:tRNA-uridine 2-sulfurtransferase